MGKDAHRRKLECQKPHNPEINIARNMNTRRSLLCADDSSTKDNELASTSPILNTTKTRRLAKLPLPQRTICDSMSEQNPAEPSKVDKNKYILKRETSPSPSTSKQSTKYPNCDYPVERDRKCKNSPNSKLTDRLRDLKRCKKATVRITDLKDAQISEEKFVESVRVLDKAHKSTPSTGSSQSPVKKLGLLPFVKLNRLSEEIMPNDSPPITYLSLDEVNEEDIFADEKDGPEPIEDLGEFRQWDYKIADMSTFYGFSSDDYIASKKIAARGPQNKEIDELSDEIKKEEILLQKSYFSLEKNNPDSELWENRFVEISKLESYKNIKDSEKDTNDFSRTKDNEIIKFSNDTKKQSAGEIYSKDDISSLTSAASIKEPVNTRFSDDCDNKLGTLEIITDTHGTSMFDDLSRIENNRRSSIADERLIPAADISRVKARSFPGINSIIEGKRDNAVDTRIKRGFSLPIKRGFATTSDNSIRVSKTAPAEAIAPLPIRRETRKYDVFDEELLENKNSPINIGFSTTSNRSISESKIDPLKVKTQSLEQKDMINVEEFNDGLDNASKLQIKTKFSPVSKDSMTRLSKTDLVKIETNIELTEGSKEELLNINQENITNSQSKYGFSTASGRPLIVSETALAKAKTKWAQVIETIKDEHSDDNVSNTPMRTKFAPDSKSWMTRLSKTALIEVETEIELKKETKKELLNIRQDMITDSPSKYGFSTAGGRPLIVSDTALAKAKAELTKLMETIKDEPSDENLDNVRDLEKNCKSNKVSSKVSVSENLQTTDDSKHKQNNEPGPSSSSSFTNPQLCPGTSTDGRSSEISEKSISKKNKSIEMNTEYKVSCDFSTARGVKLNISDDSWLKAKISLETIKEPSIEDLGLDPATDSQSTEVIELNNETEIISVSTGLVSSAESKLCHDVDYMESLDLEDFIDPFEEPEISKKRKFDDIDEDTPLRRETLLPQKKGRYVNDLQARKLFDEDTDDEETIKTVKSNSELNLINEEVHASTVALVEDEKRSNEGTTWQVNDQRETDCVSPELGFAASNRRGESIRNSLDPLNRTKVEKVNVVGSGISRGSNCYNVGSGTATDTKDTNDRAAAVEKREESQEIQVESIPDDLTFDSQFSQDIEHSPVIDKFIVEAMKIMENRLVMAAKQDEAIRGKRRIKPETCDGQLYRLRNSNRKSRISWRQFTDDVPPSAREISEDSLRRDILSVTADSAVHYRFRCADFYGENQVRSNIEGVKVGDGASLILDEQNCAGAREFERAFLASPYVDPNLVPTGWIKNHYRWIVWKFASIDRSKFGQKCLPRMLTPERVMLQLKYRYDREIYRTQWPPLRRILERGEDASARLVLCVSSIVAVECENTTLKGAETPNSIDAKMYKMRVTDGWYSITTSIDAAMISFIKSGKVMEGTKLMIFGAKVTNLDQGCSALEIPETVTLRISSNSTRRAKWDTKLDFYHANRRPMSLSLKSVRSNGGSICKMVVAISRLYPILYREKLPDGQIVFRNARCDEEAAIAHEARYQSKMEEIYANARREFQISSMNRKAVGTSKKRSYTQEEAKAYSRELEEELRQKISAKMSECLPSPRDVTPVMKMRITESDTSALVTVWSADRDTTELFVEGSTIAIYNAFTSGLRSNELQITAGRSAFVQREDSRRIVYPERIYTSLIDVTAPGFNPVYGEFDTIGMVVSTGPAPHGMKNFETVNLACPRSGDPAASDFLSILFWLGVSAHGYTKILTVGSLVACSNLEWRRNTSRSITTAYCSERSVFSKNPRHNHFLQAFESLRLLIKEPLAYATACATEIQEEVAKKSMLRTPGAGSPYKPLMSTDRTPGWGPRDMSSAFDAGCSTPKIVSNKVTTKKRFEKLEMYGEAPKLTSIVIKSSRNVLSEFRSPIRTPVSKP